MNKLKTYWSQTRYSAQQGWRVFAASSTPTPFSASAIQKRACFWYGLRSHISVLGGSISWDVILTSVASQTLIYEQTMVNRWSFRFLLPASHTFLQHQQAYSSMTQRWSVHRYSVVQVEALQHPWFVLAEESHHRPVFNSQPFKDERIYDLMHIIITSSSFPLRSTFATYFTSQNNNLQSISFQQLWDNSNGKLPENLAGASENWVLLV